MKVHKVVSWIACSALVLGLLLVVNGCSPKNKPKPKATKPTVTEPAPSATEPAPPTKEPAPPATEPAPPATEPAPPTTEPAPPTKEPAPPATEPAPPAIEPAPPATEPAPPTMEPAPPTTEPAPPATEPAPPATEPAPPTTEPAPPATEPAPPATAPAAQTPLEVKVPLGLPPLQIPENNPMTVEKVELGKQLYFDKRLSKDGTVSCATCHDPKKAWAEEHPTSTGIGGQVGGANSPTVINSAYATVQFWDGRAATLEDQAVGPIANPIEMGHTLEEMVAQLDAIADYKESFQKVFGTGVTAEGVGKAIAAFERTVLSGNSAYDKYQAGETTALNEAQVRGMKLFDDVGCSTCHTPPLFSNYKFYNAGVGMDKATPDAGRKSVTNDDSDLGKFRVPGLREVANTGPYFHDGSCATLAEAVALMASGGKDNPNISAVLKGIGAKPLADQDKADLVEFLKALSGEYPIVEPPTLP